MSLARHESHANATYQKFLNDLTQVYPMSKSRAERAAMVVLWLLEAGIARDEVRHLESQRSPVSSAARRSPRSPSCGPSGDIPKGR